MLCAELGQFVSYFMRIYGLFCYLCAEFLIKQFINNIKKLKLCLKLNQE